ncbi:Sll0445 protein [Mucinivorans hirudinis]|uniref:Sll0445 protein n=1 Tax=Mucinivorans hirudinis TaxID=1433126 RepID=A0A060RD01_9BACT|nr:Sll0445 protein [Mucinivorans hirudinis]
MLAKTLRSNKVIPNHDLINQAQIGAITVLPYFNVKQDDNSSIDSGTFISKAKSALSYYHDNISNNNTVNALYYIADTIRNSYENCDGGAGQKNNAHFIELVSALSIIDFSFANYDGKTTTHLEFGLSKDSNQVIFEDCGADTQKLLQRPLTQFVLFCKHLKERDDISQPWRIKRKFDQAFFQSQFVKDVKAIQSDYITWLNEMDDNQRRFSPFELSQTDKIFEIVKGKKPKKLITKLSSNYGLYDDFLNGQKVNNASSKEHQLIELFYNATDELVKQKINF